MTTAAKKVASRITHLQGIFITLILSFIFLNIQFGAVLYKASNTYFDARGDGMRSYYAALYQIQNDSAYLSTTAMNYPYRESSFYCYQQPLLSTSIKFISNNITDISNHTVGIYNMVMLLSFLLASLVLYLLFRNLLLPVWYSAIAAVFITYLSPQCDRILGDFSLTYIFVIPTILLLFIKFHKHSSYMLSLAIGLTTLLFGITHGYYLAFSGIIVFSFWLRSYFMEKERLGKFRVYAPHIFIQLILPFALMSLLIALGSDAQNRGSHPWGFFVNKAFVEGVFLPIDQPYGSFLSRFISFDKVQWEGRAYIGFAALVGFVVIAVKVVAAVFQLKFKQASRISKHRMLNVYFWASFILLLYSMGIPFIFNLEWLVNYIGPLRQMRSIGRFSWLFFYTLNIVMVFNLWHWQLDGKYKAAKNYLIAAALLVLCYDSWSNSKSQQQYMNNTVAELNDQQNTSEQNKWVQLIDKNNYQAIIPIPYFHTGSENVWIEGAGDIKKKAFVVSLKTGLPLTASAMGRTSIDQTFDNLQMHYEAYRKLNVLKDIPNEKDFLLLQAKGCELNAPQKSLIALAKENPTVFENNDFCLMTLKVEQLKNRCEELYKTVAEEIESDSLYQHQNVLTSDSAENFVHENFYGNLSNNSYMGVDAFEGNATTKNYIFDDTIPNYDTTRQYVISFWIGGIRRDLAARTWATISFADSTGSTYFKERYDIWRKMTVLDNDWVLFEHEFKLHHPKDKIKIVLRNPEMSGQKIYADELLIRPVDNNIFIKLTEYLGKNNRYFEIKK